MAAVQLFSFLLASRALASLPMMKEPRRVLDFTFAVFVVFVLSLVRPVWSSPDEVRGR